MKILQILLVISLLCTLTFAKVLTATSNYDYCKEYRNMKHVECSGPEPIRVKYNIAKGRISTGGLCNSDAPDTILISIYDKDSLLIKHTTNYSCKDTYGDQLVLSEDIVHDAKYMTISVFYSSAWHEYVKCTEPGKHLFETYIGSPVKIKVTCETPESYYKRRYRYFLERDECYQVWAYSDRDKALSLRDGVQPNPECADLSKIKFE